MNSQKEKFRKLTALSVVSVVSVSFTQCSVQEVRQDFGKRVERNGKSYASELAAQSPFKKVEMSWKKANDLMKARNPKYQQALIDQHQSKIRKGAVSNFTFEVRKSLNDSVQTTLNPNEIAAAMNSPVSTLPRQLKSITDLKNISHSLTQSEWDRVLQSIKADIAQRKEMVNLHVLFCQNETIDRAESELEKIVKSDPQPQNKALATELAKAQSLLKKERSEWLGQVRNFYNAEFYDVEFTDYRAKLNSYRHVTNPGFSDWKRWRLLENSEMLAGEMQKEHNDAKPMLPGMNMLKRKLGVMEIQSQLGHQKVLNEEMAKEVRQMLRGWRELKAVQQKIFASELSYSRSNVTQAPSVQDVRRITTDFQLKNEEIDKMKIFWAIDEDCW
ncbi:MAG: hypothetical protein ACSHX6_16710 [Akkermansiaceae bacterium]